MKQILAALITSAILNSPALAAEPIAAAQTLPDLIEIESQEKQLNADQAALIELKANIDEMEGNEYSFRRSAELYGKGTGMTLVFGTIWGVAYFKFLHPHGDRVSRIVHIGYLALVLGATSLSGYTAYDAYKQAEALEVEIEVSKKDLEQIKLNIEKAQKDIAKKKALLEAAKVNFEN